MSYSDKSFIEVQFPVSKISKESYKERKANLGQTLTGLGKWWGRKPLILVRAAILGLLMPASDNPKRDKEIFLKILTMDEAGLIKRKEKSIPAKVVYELLTPGEKKEYFKDNESSNKFEYKKGISREDKRNLQDIAFKRMSYDEKLEYCVRPEEIKNLDTSEWMKINEHLGTNANCLQELIKQLGEKKFGKVPVVGDCFAGGGSIPFEAARMGCNAYASDLNPIAVLLTWAALNICSAKIEVIEELREFQKNVFYEVDRQIREWSIEHNEDGHRANSYLYCNETKCPECGYIVPLSPSWVIGKGTKTVAILVEKDGYYDIEVESGVSNDMLNAVEEFVTVRSGNMYCPHCKCETPISSIRKDRRDIDGTINYGLKKWDKNKYIPDRDDVFQERLYCIRYEYHIDIGDGKIETVRYYKAPDDKDIAREEKVKELLNERFYEWQLKGYIPSMEIEEGYNTSQIIRERGWSYWHQLFNPRQLLAHGLLAESIDKNSKSYIEKAVGLLGLNKCNDWDSKLCGWINAGVNENIGHTFYNQAFNTLFNYGSKGLENISTYWFFPINKSMDRLADRSAKVNLKDARQVKNISDIWITDPPYADAVNYHELSEFFISWDRKILEKFFPNICSDWYTDSKRALAVKGSGEDFNKSMTEIYRNLSNAMPENGMQIVMFTHQNVSVWADMTIILWASGLRVTAAWNIATETDASGIKQGNYVKGTVLLVLRKQNSEDTAYLDELYPEIEEEVKRQIDSMRELDDKEDPNFSDADYLLAAYAASLKVLTSYKQIEDIDVKYELSKTRMPGEESPIEKIINEAVKIAYDYLIPGGFDSYTWKILTPEERFFIKGLDLEKEGIYQVGAYQELARGFGVKEYKELLASTKANQARLKTAMEFGMRGMSDNNRFGSSLLRNVLAALHQSIKEEDTQKGKNWLKNEVPNYWTQRNTIVEILDYISTLGHIENMGHWEQEANYAKLLRELVKSDGV